MTDLIARLQAAATAAIADIAPGIEAAGSRLRIVTVEVEVDTKGQLVGATAWLEHRVDITKLLEDEARQAERSRPTPPMEEG